jgi:hypothetical protein
MRVLVACEFSGVVREAFRKKGHTAWSCDLLPSEIPGQHIQRPAQEVVRDPRHAALYDVIKGEWGESWSEWDQSIRDGITEHLKNIEQLRRPVKTWVIAWSTESGDEGISGYWVKKPEREQILAYLQDHLTEDYKAGTLHYRLKELNAM